VFSSRYCLFECCSNISLVTLNRYLLIQLGKVHPVASISNQSLNCYWVNLWQKLTNMWRSVWKNSSINTHLLMRFPYIINIIFFFIHFFRKKRYNFQINILPLLALVIMGATMHLLFVGQIRFRHHILLGVIAIARISLYEIVLSVKTRSKRSDS